MSTESARTIALQRNKSLPLAVPVQVQCEGFLGLAYRDENGIWKDYHTGKTLTGAIRIIEHNFD
jgi:hypothetical protein